MRIAVVVACPFPSPQGSQVFVREMAENLAATGHEVHLVTYGQGSRFSRPGIRHHRARRLPGDDAMRSGPTLVKPLLDGLMAATLCRVIRRYRIDVVHAHNYEAAVVALVARALTGAAVVYHSHNLLGDELPEYFDARLARALARAFGRLLDRQVPRRADQVVALCGWSASRLEAYGVEAGRLSVVPPALTDPGRARNGALAGLVGYCGNLDRYQNLELLLEAFALLVSQRPGARLAIIGHRSEAAFAGRIDGRPGVEFRVAANFEEAHRAMAECAVLVLPRGEGSGVPIKLLNYLALGRPVVVAGCGAKLLEDERDALVVPDGDAQAMAGAMGRLLEDRELAGRIGSAGRASYERTLTWTTVLPELTRVYGRALEGRGQRRAGVIDSAGSQVHP